MVLHIMLLLSCIFYSSHAADDLMLRMMVSDMQGGLGGIFGSMMRDMLQSSGKDRKVKKMEEIIQRDDDEKLSKRLQDRELCDKTKGLVRLAACNKSYKVAQLLIEHGFDVNQGRGGQVPLRCAAVENDAKMVQILLDAGADLELIDKGGNTALHCACQNGSQEIFDMLIARGASVKTRNHTHRTPLHEAAQSGNVYIITALLPTIPYDVRDKRGYTPLMIASHKAHYEAARALLQAGASLDIVDKDGDTALHFAMATDSKMVRLLVDHGAPVMNKNKQGNTALHNVVRQKELPADYEQMITILCNAGTIDPQNGEEATPLMIAEWKEHEDAAIFLLEKGANPNVCTNDIHITALQLAVKKRLERTVAKLLEKGANPFTRTSNGNLVIEIATGDKMRELLTRGMQEWQDRVGSQE